jgi:acetylornithine/N-succinyldiaminopimelate aminotransferase
MLTVPADLASPPADPGFPAVAAGALMHVADRPRRVFTRGQGSWLWDDQGRRVLDMVQGWAVNTLGHAAPEVAHALARQATRLVQPGPGLYNDRAIELAGRLAAASGLQRCFFTSSGAEANEGAIKLARKFGQRRRGGAYEIITFEDGFHGRTLATMSASGKPGFDRLFAPQVPGFPKARLNDLASVARLIGPNTVGILLEPIQGEAGVVEASPDFLRGLRRLCDELGLLLMLDEVQTGVGRTGDLWGHTACGIRPDILTLGKGLGGGVPIGALLASEAASCFEPGDQGGTFCGNPLMCAAASAVLDVVLSPGWLQGVQARSNRLRAGLESLGVGCVLGRGLLLALELPEEGDAPRVAQAALDANEGLLVNAARPRRLRLVPALNIGEAEIDLAVERLAQALAAAGIRGRSTTV